MDDKTITIEELPKKTKENKNIREKEKVKRVITGTNKWTFSPDDMSPNSQLLLATRLLHHIQHNTIMSVDNHIAIARRLILEKVAGYKSQDMNKNLYSPEKFILVEVILQMMVQCSMCCFYCNEPVKLIYEEVRDPKQWTLERIENNQGHNMGNLQIACLTCNLRRRTMHHERYKQTKEMMVVEKLDYVDETFGISPEDLLNDT